LLCLSATDTTTDNSFSIGTISNFVPKNQDDIHTSTAYQILLNNFGEDLAAIKHGESKIIKLKKIQKYVNELSEKYSLHLCNRSMIIKELYILHQTARALEKHNNEVLGFTYIQFRNIIYFPNILYILVRLLPNAKTFLQDSIGKVYQEINNKSNGLINAHVNSFYLDKQAIKSEILYDFLGNGIKKIDPLEIGNVKPFYKSCFRSIFGYYFKKKRNLSDQDVVSFCFFDTINNKNSKSTSRSSIYKDVLYEIYVQKTQKKHTILNQLSYNFQIFRNVIVSNEFQNIYQHTKNNEHLNINNEFKLIDFFDDDIFINKPNLLDEIRKLPLIYKLLRCVHIQSTNTLPYNDFLIKPELVKMVIIEELSQSFKNLFIDSFVMDILNQIAKNFIRNILSGEYINLITFSTVRINHLSFLEQLRKFIRLCLNN
jgi:hypothetical protein